MGKMGKMGKEEILCHTWQWKKISSESCFYENYYSIQTRSFKLVFGIVGKAKKTQVICESHASICECLDITKSCQ